MAWRSTAISKLASMLWLRGGRMQGKGTLGARERKSPVFLRNRILLTSCDHLVDLSFRLFDQPITASGKGRRPGRKQRTVGRGPPWGFWGQLTRQWLSQSRVVSKLPLRMLLDSWRRPWSDTWLNGAELRSQQFRRSTPKCELVTPEQNGEGSREDEQTRGSQDCLLCYQNSQKV